MIDNIETIRATSPRYADLLDKDANLSARYDEIGPRGRAITQARTKHVSDWISQSPKPKPRPLARHQGAEALLGDLLPPLSPEELTPPPLPESWHGAAELREITAELEAISEARKLLAIEIKKGRIEYSKLVAAQRAAEYGKIADKVVAAAKRFGDTLLQHSEFINSLRLEGVDRKYLRPLNVQAFGDLSEQHSPLRSLIDDAIEKNHANEKDRPDWKMPAPFQIVSQ